MEQCSVCGDVHGVERACGGTPTYRPSDDRTRADDRKHLASIMEAYAPEQLAARIYDYYHDANRADRTSRSQMYLHMGMLAGAILRAVDRHPLPVSWGDTREKSE